MRITLLSALLITSCAQAATPIDGLYSSLFGGYTYTPKNINLVDLGLYHDGSGYSGGFNAGGRLGYQGHPLRYEVEYTYLRSNLKHFEINTIRQRNVHGFSAANLIMANVYYDFPDMLPTISPFLGVGIGYAAITASLAADLTLDTPPYFFPIRHHLSLNDNAFAYQGTVGFTYNFCEQYAVNIAYRYVATTSSNVFGEPFQAHNASVGAIYRFDEGLYK